ncbi:C-factor-like isoform X2 [Thrips palmi]|nr:C-factor-like isoform X2 [Thrips palmi]
MSSVLITGCNRGLGLELVRQLLLHPQAPSVLIATCRKPEDAHALQTLAKAHSQLYVLKLEVNDFSSYDAFAQTVKSIVGDKGLNVLINNAGILLQNHSSFSNCTVESLTDTYVTNTVGPIMLVKALRPLLKLAADSNADLPMGWSRAAIINMSSGLGSVGNNTLGSYFGYRESKAALNTATRSMSYELGPQNIFVLSMHPGWVQTDLGTSQAPLTVEQSISGMLAVFFSMKPEQHGAFLHWDGKEGIW